MKKLLSIVAVLALCAAPVMADTLELRIVSDADEVEVTVPSYPATVDVKIEGRLVTGDTDGLALFGVNLSATLGAVDLCNTTDFLVEAPAALSEFDRNEGLTNPPDMAASGFSGTCDGANGLWQIGGGQNTIGNTGPTLYPIGTVETGVCNGGWTTLAEGSITVSEDTTLLLDTPFANTLDTSGGPSVYPVTAATCTIVGDLKIVEGASCPGIGAGSACEYADVNGDGVCDGLDIAEIRNTANWGIHPSLDPNANICADINGDDIIDGLDIAEVRNTACWGL